MKRLVRVVSSPRRLLGRVSRLITDEALRFTLSPGAMADPSVTLVPSTPWHSEAARLRGLSPGDSACQRGERAVRVLGGEIRLWDHLVVDPRQLSWSRDPITKRCAPRHWFTRVPYLDPSVVGDHKGVWELNRMQWLLDVAWLHATRESAATLEFLERTLQHWFHDNPPGVGINWTSALEVAYRSITLTAIAQLVQRSSQPLSAGLARQLTGHLSNAMHYVRSRLSRSFAPNTHLTGEALCLLVLGTAWPAFPKADQSAALGWQILSDELSRQLRNDGTYFEQSSWYHAYTVDIYAEAVLWGGMRGWRFPDDAFLRFRKATIVLAEFRRPDGSFICVGDDDGGSLWGDAFDGPADFAATEHRGRVATGITVRADPDWTVSVLPDGGLCSIRDGCGSGADYLLADAGPHGAYGHGHDDPLTVDLSVEGRQIVVDAGTGSYSDAAVRNALRSRSQHATLDHPALPRPLPDGPFGWQARVSGTVRRVGASETLAWCVLSLGRSGRATHLRTVIRVRHTCWVVLDAVQQLPASGSVVLRFPLRDEQCTWHPGLNDQSSGRLHVGDDAVLHTDPAMEVSIRPGVRSPRYGELRPCVILEGVNRHLAVDAWCTMVEAGPSSTESGLERAGDTWLFNGTRGKLTIALLRSPDLLLTGISVRHGADHQTIEISA